MALILLAWELGANLGHVAPMRTLARHLADRGHRCVFAARDLSAAEEFIEPELGPVLQAPVRLGAGRNPVQLQVSYASVLNNIGFDEILGLAARIRAWRQLLELVKPRAVICDHAPTAMAAVRSYGLPCAHIGAGFSVPPLLQPFPVYEPRVAVAPELLARNEAAVLQNLNSALQRLGLPAFGSLQEIFAGSTGYLLTYPELDHYDVARSERYMGLPDTAQGMAPVWPEGQGAKILAYLRPSRQLQPVLTALQRSEARVLVRIGDLRADQLKQFLRPGLVITDRMVNMRLAAQSCDAYVNYSSHGVIGEMLLAGKPGLLLPDVQERALVARRVEQMGAGLVPPAEGSFNLSEALTRLTTDPALRAAAQAFAARHAQQDRSQILLKIADETLARLA